MPDRPGVQLLRASQRQVRKMVAGPGVFTCERCVDLAGEVLAEGKERSNRRTNLALEQEPEARCSFCGKRLREVTGMVVAPDRPAKKFSRKRYARRFPGVREASDCLAVCAEVAEHFN